MDLLYLTCFCLVNPKASWSAWTPVFRQLVLKQRNRSLEMLWSLQPHLCPFGILTTCLDTALSNLLVSHPALIRALDQNVSRLLPKVQLFCCSVTLESIDCTNCNGSLNTQLGCRHICSFILA